MDIYGRAFLAKLDPGEVIATGSRVYLVNPAWMDQGDSEGSDIDVSTEPRQIPATIIDPNSALTHDSVLIVHGIGDRFVATVQKSKPVGPAGSPCSPCSIPIQDLHATVRYNSHKDLSGAWVVVTESVTLHYYPDDTAVFPAGDGTPVWFSGFAERTYGGTTQYIGFQVSCAAAYSGVVSFGVLATPTNPTVYSYPSNASGVTYSCSPWSFDWTATPDPNGGMLSLIEAIVTQ